MSSCDEAVARYNIAEQKVETAFAIMAMWAVVFGVSAVFLLAAFVAGFVALKLLGTPAGFISAAALLAVAGLGVLAVTGLVTATVGLVAAISAWLSAMNELDQAYAELWNKCQGEPDRIPAYHDT